MPLTRRPRPAGRIDAPATDEIAARLQSADDDIRWAAARAASGQQAHIDLLAGALVRESSPNVREALFTSLSATSSPLAVTRLLPLLRSDDARLRTGTLDALRSMNRVVDPFLPELLADADPDVRSLACELVREAPAERATRLLSELLDRESSPNVCASAVDVLADIGQSAALPALQRCATRFAGQSFLAFAIRIAIGRLRPPGGP